MFQGLNVFKVAHAMAIHAGQRQAVVSQNIANSDTPGYKAQDIQRFADIHRADAASGMRASRVGHMNNTEAGSTALLTFATDAATDPNGNSVSVELELLKGVESKRQHDRAIAIYKSSLNVLRTSLGRS